MTIVVDASVATKWFVRELGSEAARNMAVADPDLLAPDLIVPEVANALWRHILVGELDIERALAAVASLPRLLRELISSQQLVEPALSLAVQLKHPVYDCIYVALAQQRSAPLVTADRRLLGRIMESGIPVSARLLESFV